MYIRFETRDGTGLFHAAYRLRDAVRDRTAHVRRRDDRELLLLIRWLNAETPIPPGTAYVDARCRLPRTWFRAEAEGHIAVARRLADVLNLYRIGVRMITSPNPGAILWSDEVQAVVRTRDRIGPSRTKRAPVMGWSGDRATIRTAGLRLHAWKEPDWSATIRERASTQWA